jgi:hypothetical protein
MVIASSQSVSFASSLSMFLSDCFDLKHPYQQNHQHHQVLPLALHPGHPLFPQLLQRNYHRQQLQIFKLHSSFLPAIVS